MVKLTHDGHFLAGAEDGERISLAHFVKILYLARELLVRLDLDPEIDLGKAANAYVPVNESILVLEKLSIIVR